MHVLKVMQVGNAKYCVCECGHPLTVLYDDYSEDAVMNLVQGHREHALMEAGVLSALRVGNTTQWSAPIDPLLDLPDLKDAKAISNNE